MEIGLALRWACEIVLFDMASRENATKGFNRATKTTTCDNSRHYKNIVLIEKACEGIKLLGMHRQVQVSVMKFQNPFP